jgi:hypothetical protein
MIETATLITLSMLFLIFFRPGKTPPLQNPLLIERPGRYHLTLAPQLNLAQVFIEAVADKIAETAEAMQNSETYYFEVCDKQVAAHGYDTYLLAITQREGMLLVQAARPESNEQSANLQTIRDFSHAVLARYPDDEVHGSGEKIIAAMQSEAKRRDISIRML